jgi:hypothetical protein|nr:MAG TPA: hypothetical protein [Caudoviricetes sp.]
MEYLTIDNDKLTYFMNKIYNQWFVKWRDVPMPLSREQAQQLVDESVEIAEEGKDYSMVIELLKVFHNEFDERDRLANCK